MKKIPLTRGRVALVDDEDYERLAQYKWYCTWHNYAVRDVGPRLISMASEVLQTENRVDHKNNNSLNNQRYNLRECTVSQNAFNTKKIKGASSKYKGVSFQRSRKLWYTCISFRDIFGQKAKIFLGRFEVEKDAAKAYDEAARRYQGKFATLNFPRKGERSCLC